MPRIFISYRRSDTAYVATMIAEKLIDQYGPNSVFLDIDNIPLGVDFRKHIDNAVARSDILLALIGDSWMQASDENGRRRLDDPSDFLRIEIESALRRNIPVIPVLTGKATMPVEADLPESLSDFAYRNACELRAGYDFRTHLERLLSGLAAFFERRKRRLNPLPKPVPHGTPNRASPWATRMENAFLLREPSTSLARVFRMLYFVGFVISAIMTVSLTNHMFATDWHEKYSTGVWITSWLISCCLFFWIPLYLCFWLPARLLDKKPS